MPASPGSVEEDLPEAPGPEWQRLGGYGSSEDGEDGEQVPDHVSVSDSEEDPDRIEERAREKREFHEPKDGKFYDHGLWYGKTLEQIKYATELEKSNGNAAGRDGDWKKATGYWKRALLGAEKLQDADMEMRLRLNLALAYTKREKYENALDHADVCLSQRLCVSSAPALRAKAHYRRAEIHVAADEISKAFAELRATLEIEPANADARKRWAELKALEREQRERERELFRGIIPQISPEAAEVAGIEESVRAEVADEEARIMASLTDRSRSAGLAQGAMNVRVGPTMTIGGKGAQAAPLLAGGSCEGEGGASDSECNEGGEVVGQGQ